ncbi:methyltransferase domain-containing protein [Salibacter halophilus]|uniref:Methyltransferase domain-containing protein n=1 Tax=Salibacter halophilus TaxID=1803916 RepID=A0A6N6MAD4_9FLAO|nr:methyltransferase domain-containing protein [Salibacter halophilus]KAB1065949.1 methyltransferase domain-containing protein [Salibacter halophilus]
MASQDLVKTTKDYYDSTDADEFYYRVWGGEDIHIGIYESPDEDIFTASARTVKKMTSLLPAIDENTKVLDMGSGYGGSARYLVSQFGCHVTCINLSDTENERNKVRTKEKGLEEYIDIHSDNFEKMPYDDESFDLIWMQDAILHSGNKEQVFKEIQRVLKPGGHFIFTDPMQSDDCPDGVLEPILKRIHLGELGSVKRYRQLAAANNLEAVNILEMPDQLRQHYTNVLKGLNNQREELTEVCSETYLENMESGLNHWIEGAKKGYLNWGIIHLRKK